MNNTLTALSLVFALVTAGLTSVANAETRIKAGNEVEINVGDISQISTGNVSGTTIWVGGDEDESDLEINVGDWISDGVGTACVRIPGAGITIGCQ